MVKLDKHYVDPRLVDLYDIENPRGIDTDFYVTLADEIQAKRVVDLGCGTGLITRAFIKEGREVIGVDPAPAMLAYAKRQPDADKIQWINGTASVIGKQDADLLVMTGNVSQVFLDDDDWKTTLSHIYSALRPDGYLSFEIRNPDYREWEKWNREDSFFAYKSPHGQIESWVETVNITDKTVQFEGHNVFKATGETVIVESEIRFRTCEDVTQSLIDTGFTVEHIYGHWDKTPLSDSSRLMIFVVRRNSDD